MARKLAAVPEVPARTLPDLRASVLAAVADMDWLTPADQPLADLAVSLADQIEESVARAEALADLFREVEGDRGLIKRLQLLEAQCSAAKMVGWLGPQLQGVLRDLAGAPSARRAMAKDEPTGGRLAEIRSAANRATSPAAAKRAPAKRSAAKRASGRAG